MAINPLQPPTNYAGIAPQINLGQQFSEFGQVLADRRKRVQAEELKQTYEADLKAAVANPTQETWNNMIAKYPQYREAFSAVRQNYGDKAVENEFTQGFEVSLALENNRPEIARNKLLEIITARKTANLPVGLYERTLDALVANNVKGAQAGVNYALSIADPDRFKKQVDARLSAAKAPAEVMKAEGEAAKSAAEGKVATGTVDADITKRKADAAKATSDAKTALATADNAADKAAAERRLALAQAKEKELAVEVDTATKDARIIEAKKPKLAPSVQESIDYANLTADQKTTFDSLQVAKKPPAAVTNINVNNLEKTSQDGLGKLVPDLYEQANSAVTQVQDIPRYRTALQNAIVGPLANTRLTANQIGEFFGFTGDKRINATRELIQGLSEMALKSRSMLTGQGSITEGEQALLLKARSGDISFTKGELDIILNVAERAARAQYEKSTNLLRSASTKSPTAQMFLDNVKAMPEAQLPPNTVKVGDKTYTRPSDFTDKQWADYKQQVGAK